MKASSMYPGLLAALLVLSPAGAAMAAPAGATDSATPVATPQKAKAKAKAKPKAKSKARAKVKARKATVPVSAVTAAPAAPVALPAVVAAVPVLTPVVVAAAEPVPQEAPQSPSQYTGYNPYRPAVNPYLAYQSPAQPFDPAQNVSVVKNNLLSFLPSIPDGQSLLPSIKKVYPTGEKPLVVVTFKCPTELIGITPLPTKGLHELVNLAMDGINATNLLSFNLQQVCQ